MVRHADEPLTELPTDLCYLAVLDFEATCDERDSGSDFNPSAQEIIELPVGLIDIERGQVIDTFRTLVRPVVQPQLTPFCTELTSITQEQLAGQPTIGEAMGLFTDWLDSHNLGPENCLAVTCGDWDLLHMWPRQVSLAEGLQTPPLFRRWCNIKVVFQHALGHKAPGMMGMLRHAGIEHVGHHHLGIDDVRNLCNLTLWLVANGAEFVPTFTAERRQQEYRRRQKKVQQQERARNDRHKVLQHLPDTTDADVRAHMRASVQRLDEEIVRLRRMADVFA